MKKQEPALSWSSLFLLTFLAAEGYIFMEWLFAVTRPSYLNNLALARQALVFIFAGGLLAGLCYLILLPLALLSLLPRLRGYKRLLVKLGGFLPATLFAALILLLFDNFTYTLFHFGIVSTAGLIRLLYGLGFILVWIACYRNVMNALYGLSRCITARRSAPTWTFSLLAAALLFSFAVPLIVNGSQFSMHNLASASGGERRPNILLITSDGVDAAHMSVYGYGRDTTPRLRALAESALVAENAFSNSGPTAGSVISIYTGKYPAATRVLYPPDILKGVDSYQHLPGILRSLGYQTAQLTLPHFVDAYELNVLDGFDTANGRSAAQSKFLTAISQVLPSDYAFFTYETANRILDRLRHIFFLKTMTNPYALVTSKPGRFVDQERLETLRQLLGTAERPLFVHVHLMGTHGDTFHPQIQHFSAGQSIEQQTAWSDDFYDDSILELDTNIGALVDDLKAHDLLDKTILVIGSDHGQHWQQITRVPLIMRFPEGQYAGRIQANVQNLDIAPTLLDYIGLEIPDWMRGQSLIADELERRPIFGVSSQGQEPGKDGEFMVNWDKVSAPFYQFGEVTLIYCQKWYRLDLTDLSWESGAVADSTSPCQADEAIPDQQAFQWMVTHLEQNGFDVSSLDRFPPATPESN